MSRVARSVLVGEALPRRLRLLLLLLVVEVYAAIFVPLYDVAGNAALSVFALVTAIAGGMLGVRGGLFVALVGLLIHALPFGVLAEVDPTLMPPIAAVSYALAVLACAVGFGLMQDYRSHSGVFALVPADARPQRASDDVSQRDALTGLPNRLGLAHRLDAMVARARGDTALLVLDLDRFKDLNESLGGVVGDDLLRAIGERLFEHAGVAAQAARLGGDEFAVVLPGADERAAAVLARRLSDAIRAPVTLGPQEVFVGASIGIALAPRDGRDAGTLLRKAESAMYVAKRGRLPWAMHSPAPEEPAQAFLALTADLRRAIERDELALAFQPIVACDTRRLQRFEALARWPRRDVLAADFVALAERVGLLSALTDHVITSAVRQLHGWASAGQDARVAVNLARRNLLEPDLARRVDAALRASSVPGSRLGIEVTETAVMADPERAARTMHELRDLGVSIAVDGFGTGHSSLSYLHRIPVSAVKLDRSLVRGIVSDADARAIVRATVDLAHALDFTVVAEGVEDEQTLDIARELGCDQAQGYFIARPLTPTDAARWLRAPTT